MPALPDALAYLRTIRLPRHQLERLGLDEGWAAKADPAFVARALGLIERYRPLLEELGMYSACDDAKIRAAHVSSRAARIGRTYRAYVDRMTTPQGVYSGAPPPSPEPARPCLGAPSRWRFRQPAHRPRRGLVRPCRRIGCSPVA